MALRNCVRVGGTDAWVRGALALLLAVFAPVAAKAQTPVDLELVLAVDVSGSMTLSELEIQRRGYASALVDEEVRSNPGVYPSASTMEKLLVLKTPSDKESRTMNRLWTRAKTGR